MFCLLYHPNWTEAKPFGKNPAENVVKSTAELFNFKVRDKIVHSLRRLSIRYSATSLWSCTSNLVDHGLYVKVGSLDFVCVATAARLLPVSWTVWYNGIVTLFAISCVESFSKEVPIWLTLTRMINAPSHNTFSNVYSRSLTNWTPGTFQWAFVSRFRPFIFDGDDWVFVPPILQGSRFVLQRTYSSSYLRI